MRAKLLWPCLAVATLMLLAAPVQNKRAVTLPGSVFSQAEAIIIQDDWEGSGMFSPRIVHAQFHKQGKLWRGNVFLCVSCRRPGYTAKGSKSCQKIVASTIPDAVMQKAFAILQQAPLQKKSYEPILLYPDDFPQPLILIRSPTQIVTFESDSNAPGFAPWQVQKNGLEYAVTTGRPDDALKLLRPFLRESELNALKLQAARRR